MTKKFVICNLKLESAGVPRIIQIDIIGVNKCQFLICKKKPID